MGQRIYKIGVIILIIILLGLIPVIKNHFNDTASAIALDGALDETREIGQTLKSFRFLYTTKVVNEVNNLTDISVVHDYDNPKYDSIGGAIPLPATLSMELSKGMSTKNININLYSKYPFPRRADRVLTAFEDRAWEYFQTNSKESYYEYDEINNLLSYSIPDKMVSQSCVDCHNSHPESPKIDWKLGDVRGVISVVKKVQGSQLIQASNTTNYFLFGAIALIALLIVLFNLKIASIVKKDAIEKNIFLNIKIKELKLAQAGLIRSEKLATIGTLAAGLAHELKNPLSFVSVGSQGLEQDVADLMLVLDKYDLLLEKDGDFDQSKITELEEFKNEVDYQFLRKNIPQIMADVKIGAKRMVDIVNGMKNFSRKSETNMILSNIHDGIRETLILLNFRLKHKVEVITDFDDSIEPFFCFPGELNQVFMNIINNGEQAIKETGVITIKTQLKQEKVYISIKDDGSGMDKSTLDNIFKSFFTTKGIGVGTGLGLSISKSIIDEHDGEIEVKSELGEGSEFIICLPYNKQPTSG